MRFQYDFFGGTTMQNTGYLVCGKCENAPAWQYKLLILPPDPPPLMNTRPENYVVDETNWLTTQDGSVFETQAGSTYVTPVNPDNDPNLSVLSASLVYPSGSVAVAYYDLFIGDPSGVGAVSVLSLVTGSATRVDIASSLTTTDGIATNLSVISVSAGVVSTTNVEYIGLYSAASGGTLLVSGPVSATFPTLVEGAAVQFDALSLSIDIN